MPNAITGFFETLTAVASEASQLLAPTWAAAQSVYLDFKPESAAIGQTLNVVIPQDPTTNVTDVGNGDIPLTDANWNATPIVMDKHPAHGVMIRNFEQFNTKTSIRDAYVDPGLKAIKNHINARVAALFTTGNFTTNAAVSATSGFPTTAQFLAAQALLLDQNVNVNDRANMSFLLPSVPYTKVVGNSDWTNASIAGDKRAEVIRENGEMPTTYGATLKVDQQMPVSGSSPSRTWTAAYLHRWAIALATRPLPAPDGNVVEYTYQDFYGIPVLIQLGWNQQKSGYMLTFEAGYGLKVVRENMGVLFTIAE